MLGTGTFRKVPVTITSTAPSSPAIDLGHTLDWFVTRTST